METEEQLIARAEAWAASKKDAPASRHSPDDYIAEFNAIAAYIDRSREMHPYVQAYFYELLIDAVTSLIEVAKPPPPEKHAAEEEPPHSRRRR